MSREGFINSMTLFQRSFQMTCFMEFALWVNFVLARFLVFSVLPLLFGTQWVILKWEQFELLRTSSLNHLGFFCCCLV